MKFCGLFIFLSAIASPTLASDAGSGGCIFLVRATAEFKALIGENPPAHLPPNIGTDVIVVHGFLPDSPAKEAGVKEGDALFRIDRTLIKDTQTFDACRKEIRSGQEVEFGVRRPIGPKDSPHARWVTRNYSFTADAASREDADLSEIRERMPAQAAAFQPPEQVCREIALHEYPNNPRMAEFVFRQQMAASRYMAAVNDESVKAFAEREHPKNYSMQQFEYDRQVAAKRYMGTVSDADVRTFAVREHPKNFAMQQFEYDRQLAAKQFITALPDSAAKRAALSEYPNNYCMQQFVYEKAQ